MEKANTYRKLTLDVSPRTHRLVLGYAEWNREYSSWKKIVSIPWFSFNIKVSFVAY